MTELSTFIPRRMREPNFMRRYFVRDASISASGRIHCRCARELFPLKGDVRIWDLGEGPHHSCLASPMTLQFRPGEHLRDPGEGLRIGCESPSPMAFLPLRLPTKISTSKPLEAEKDVELRGGDSRRGCASAATQYRDEHQQMKRARASRAPFFESGYAVARALP